LKLLHISLNTSFIDTTTLKVKKHRLVIIVFRIGIEILKETCGRLRWLGQETGHSMPETGHSGLALCEGLQTSVKTN
jgi:hypothetical protein